ncbi:MAG TPA: DNA mismatch repair protein MutS [Clostridiales bacterium]|nr:DNA mismatch repair protein MutS [Clostridiales bacterium]
MNFILYYVLIILIIAVSLIISNIKSNIKLKSTLTSSFGKVPEQKKCEFESIGSYHRYKKKHLGNSETIDSITWDDLDMNLVFKRINTSLTSVGEEYMYDTLHQVQNNEDILLKRERLITFLDNNPDDRLKLQMDLAKSGKHNYNGIASFIFEPSTKSLKYSMLYNILTIIPIICIITAFFNMQVGILCLILSGILNGFVYYGTKAKIESELSAIRYFSSILQCLNKICKLKSFETAPFFDELKKSFNIFKPLRTKLSNILQNDFSDMAVFAEYIKIIFLVDIRNYNKAIGMISKYSDNFHTLYKCMGEIDMAICILSFRKSLPFYCLPVFHNENSVYFENLYHPLLSSPVSNSGTINNDSIITGSNASGKSTFIKALAVNGILAQTIYTCAASNFKLRHSLIITSMAVRDNISEGDSYFIKEIKSLKRIFDTVQSTPCTCFVDEILKGTNTIERIAASSSVLKYLHSKDCLCITASHDIELTNILKAEYDNYHFCEQISDDGIQFDYKLKQGPSQTRNAIKLLYYMNFDSQIVEDAETMVDNFIKSNEW